MADKSALGLAENTTPILTDGAYSGDELSTDAFLRFQRLLSGVGIAPGGRITGSSLYPVIYSDLTAVTTIYYLPYIHNVVQLYDTANGAWVTHLIGSGLSMSVPTGTNTNHDIFLYRNSGSAAMTSIAWSNDTTRATDVERFEGRMVLSGSNDKLLVGTIRTTGVSGQTEDSTSKRFINNYYHQVGKGCYFYSYTNHRYITQAWRARNNDTDARIHYVLSRPTVVDVSILEDNYNTANGKWYMVGLAANTTSSATINALFSMASRHTDSASGRYMRNPGYDWWQATEYGDNFNQFYADVYISGNIPC